MKHTEDLTPLYTQVVSDLGINPTQVLADIHDITHTTPVPPPAGATRLITTPLPEVTP